jgi:dipeptidyl aminopeptidase/acylaminoacyl peptidase
VKTKVLYRPDENTPFKPVLTTDWTTYMHPLFFDFDNRTVFAASNVGRDKTAIVQYDLERKEELAVIYENEDVDVFDIGYSLQRSCLTWVGFADEKWEMVWLDSAASRLMQRIREDLGQEVEIKINAMDQGESRFVVRTYSDRSLGSWYLYDAGMDLLMKLADANPAIDPSQMAAMQPFTYQARDGLALPAYLTLPTGRLAEGLPLVVMPHGGPRARTYWGFQPEVQLLANRGYAVLQVNYRGSLGYGRAFARAGFGAWGDGMQNDLQDGVHYLVDAGTVDPQRVAIAGYSFGGYCALAGLAFQPETYACGVSRSGLTDLTNYVDSIPDRWAPYREMLYNMVGDPKRDSARLVQFSPAQHSQSIQAPLLVVHGVQDKQIPVSQPRQLVRLLEKEGKPVYYLEFPDAGHRFLREEQRLHFYETMVGFLGRFMPADLRPATEPNGFPPKPLVRLDSNEG